MKKSMIGLSILAVGLLSACQKDDVTTPEQGGNASKAYASLTLDLGSKAPLSRALTQPDAEGNLLEKSYRDVQLISSLTTLPKLDLATDFQGTGTDGEYTTKKAYEAVAGQQRMALTMNMDDKAPKAADLTADYVKSPLGGDYEAVYDYFIKGKKVSGTGSQMVEDKATKAPVFTSRVDLKTVKPNITKDDAEATRDAAHNNFSFVLERAACKGIVVMPATGVDVKKLKGLSDYGSKFEDFTYAPVNGATHNFVFTNNAGERKLGADNKYKGFKSAIHGSAAAELPTDAYTTQHLVRLGEIGTFATTGAYKAQPVAKNTDDLSADALTNSDKEEFKGFYFFENSADMTPDLRTKNGFWRLAYAKVYAKYTPKKLFNLVDGKLKLVEVAECDLFTNGGDEENSKSLESPKERIPLKKGTFFVGEKDNVLYASREAAAASTFAPNQKAFCYNGGKCGYRALWNRQDPSGSEVVCADTRRNNTYVLTVGEILALGFPYDSSDPQDPNLPINPNDPDSPIPGGGGDGSIEDQPTFITVTAKVVKWNVVSRDNISLGGKN